jgi:hypothetical protein
MQYQKHFCGHLPYLTFASKASILRFMNSRSYLRVQVAARTKEGIVQWDEQTKTRQTWNNGKDSLPDDTQKDKQLCLEQAASLVLYGTNCECILSPAIKSNAKAL